MNINLKKLLNVLLLPLLSFGVSAQTYNAPTTGTDTYTLTTGTYTVYDDGGPSGNYSNLSNGTIIFYVPAGSTISGTYDTEAGYDMLSVRDGATTILNNVSGSSTLSQRLITSGIISIFFDTDGSVHDSGYEFTITVPLTCEDIITTISNVTENSAQITWSDVAPVAGYNVTVKNPLTNAIVASFSNVASPLEISTLSASTNYLVTIEKPACSSSVILHTLAPPPWLDDDNVVPFCTDANPLGITFPAGTTNANIPFNGGSIGCLSSTPAPAWFVFRIDDPGDLVIYMSHDGNRDIDFILWGPFSGTSKQDVLDNVRAGMPGSLAAHSTGDRCSYSSSYQETATIHNAQHGEWYVFLITNYSKAAGNISFNKIGGTATTSCNIIIDVSTNSPICEDEELRMWVNNAPTGATFEWTGPNGFTSTSNTPTIPNAKPIHSGDYSVVMTVDGNISDPVSVTVTVNPKQTAYDTVLIDYGDSYVFGNRNLTVTGDYQHMFATVAGCDSLVHLNLNVGCQNKSETVNLTINQVDLPYTWRDTTFQTGTTDQTIVFNRATSLGCDSIVTVHVTVPCIPPLVTIQENSVCLNDTIHLQFTGVAPFDLDYTFNGTPQNITVSGMDTVLVATLAGANPFAMHSLLAGDGCSITGGGTTFPIDVLLPDTTTINDTIFVGESYTENGFTLPVQTSAGTVLSTLHRQNQYGCDSIVLLELIVNDPPCIPPTLTILENSICLNDSIHLEFTDIAPFDLEYTFNGIRQSITVTGMNTALKARLAGVNDFIVHSLIDGNGCSISGTAVGITPITVLSPDTIRISDHIFIGESYNENGFSIPVQNVATTLEDTLHLQNQYTCDSLVILTLDIVCQSDTIYIADTILIGESYNANGFSIPVQTSSGVVLDTLRYINQALCDSLEILILNVQCIPPTITILDNSVCLNDSIHLQFTGGAPYNLDYVFNGIRQSIAISGNNKTLAATLTGENPFVVHSLSAANGCLLIGENSDGSGKQVDNTIWATRNVGTPGSFATTAEDGGMFYQWNSKIGWSTSDPMQNSNGGTTWNTTAATGTEWEQTNSPCPEGWRVPTDGEFWNLISTGSTQTTQNGVLGRLSTIANNTIFLPYAVTSDGKISGWREEANGSLYVYEDDVLAGPPHSDYWTGSQYDSNNAMGICFRDADNPVQNVADRRFAALVRCVKDIVYQDTITVNPIYWDTLTTSICANDSILFNGNYYNTAGLYTDSLQTQLGCDSIATLNLTILPIHANNISESIFVGNGYTDNGFSIPVQTAEGTVFDTLHLQNQYGCDSLVFLELDVQCINETQNIVDSIFVGESYNENGFSIPIQNSETTLTETLNLHTQYGCDSTVTLTLKVQCIRDTIRFEETIFVGQSYNNNGFAVPTQDLKTTITQQLDLQNQYHCDSTVILTLHVACTAADTKQIYDTIFVGESYNKYGFTIPVQNSEGVVTDVQNLQNQHLCDSIITLTLRVFPVVYKTICDSELPFTLLGVTFDESTISGTYILNEGLSSMLALHLIVNTTPQFDIINTDKTVCQTADNTTIVAGSFNPAFDANSRLQWTVINEEGVRTVVPNESNQSILANSALFPQAGEYRVEAVYKYLENSIECTSDTLSVQYIIVESPLPPVVTSKIMCDGEVSNLQALGSPLIQWVSTDNKLPNWMGEIYNFEQLGLTDVLKLGKYEFELFDIDALSGCESERVQATFEIAPQANPEILGRTQLCKQTTEEAYGLATALADSKYSWSISSGNTTYSKAPYSSVCYVDWNDAGIDTLYLYERTWAGCEGYDTLVVSIADYPKPYYTWSLPGAGTTIEFTDSSYQAPIVTHQADGSLLEIPLTYTMEWFFDSPVNRDTSLMDMFVDYAERFNPIQIHDYSFGNKYPILAVTNSFGCRATYTTEIFVDIKAGVYIPNAFSPTNAASSVRMFKPVAFNLEYCKVWIYDQWGNLLWYGDRVEDGIFILIGTFELVVVPLPNWPNSLFPNAYKSLFASTIVECDPPAEINPYSLASSQERSTKSSPNVQ